MAPGSPSTTSPLASSSFHILVALADEPRYGLAIAEEVARYTRNEVQLGPGTLYNTIKKLLSARLVEEVPLDDEDDPRRRYYAITRAGRLAMEAEAERLAELVQAIRDKRLMPSKS